MNEVVIKLNPGKNPYVFVEFADDRGAARARKTLFLDDKLGIKRRELGDASLEITYSKKAERKKIDKNGMLGRGPNPLQLFELRDMSS